MMRTRIYTIVVVAAVLWQYVAVSLADDSGGGCPVPNVPGNPGLADNLCQFYMGAMSFRQKQYRAASQAWKKVMETETAISRDSWLKWAAQGNYAYLLYFGLGEQVQKERAVSLFQEAAEHGHLESRSHLGFAYSDKTFSGYDLPIAYAWLASVEMRFDKDRKGRIDDLMRKSNRQLLDSVKQEMTTEQVARGDVLAERYARTAE